MLLYQTLASQPQFRLPKWMPSDEPSKVARALSRILS